MDENAQEPAIYYCDYIAALPDGERKDLHKDYHDNHYGFPIHDDNELFGRLVLEINQAGLSWETILKKAHNFRRAFDHFDIAIVANYGAAERERLLADPGIIRNRLKIDAVIHNAKVLIEMQKQYGSFEKWLAGHYPLTRQEWVMLFKKHFKFVGGEIVNEFLTSIGYLKNPHREDCPVYKKTLESNPKWR